MKHVLYSNLFVELVWLAVIGGLVCLSDATTQPQATVASPSGSPRNGNLPAACRLRVTITNILTTVAMGRYSCLHIPEKGDFI